jgi:xylulokinase
MKEIVSHRDREAVHTSRKLVVGYFVAGYPDRDAFFEILREAEEKGIDIFEIGFPAKNPTADGPVIRDAMSKAAPGIGDDIGFWKKIRETVQGPVWLMGYREDLIASGRYRTFAEAGCYDGLVVPDIEESEGRALQDEMKAFGVDVIGFIGPHSLLIDSANCIARFPIIYQMLYSGKTGQAASNEDFRDIMALAKKESDTHLFAGFGISTPERVGELLDSGFDGVIIGTAIVKHLNNSRAEMEEFIESLRKTADAHSTAGAVLAADVGTTAVKVTMVDSDSRILAEGSRDIALYQENGRIEQDPAEWYEAFCEAAKEVLRKSGIKPEGIAFSGQMQDVILLPGSGRAILYSDARAGEQAEKIRAKIGAEEIMHVTGNLCDGAIPFAKLIWLKEKEPDRLAGAGAVVFSAKDYIVWRLTGQKMTDVVTASTSGLMDIRKRIWREDWMEKMGLAPELLPRLAYPTETAGRVTAAGENLSGIPAGTPVYAGIGDAGAATLASGISREGEYNINLGTSGWVAAVSGDVPENQGYFNLAFPSADRYINTVPFYNAGIVHKWVSRIAASGEENRYAAASRLLAESCPGSHGVQFLPYLQGERYPVSDADIRGGYVGITPETTAADLVRAALEGVAYSIRSGFADPEKIRTISLIGGGAREKTWCQIFADVLDHEVMVFRNAGYMPTLAVAAIARVGGGKMSSLDEFIREVRASEDCDIYRPDPEAVPVMRAGFARFLRLYPALRTVEEK